MTLDALAKAPDLVQLRGVVWPLCIAGSLASASQRDRVRDLMQRMAKQADTSFGNSGQIICIVEHCWEHGVTWREAMLASNNVTLLI